MNKTIDVSDLTPEQIEQIYALIETFKTLNEHQQEFTQEKDSNFDPTSLFFESEILEDFNRSRLYDNRT